MASAADARVVSVQQIEARGRALISAVDALAQCLMQHQKHSRIKVKGKVEKSSDTGDMTVDMGMFEFSVAEGRSKDDAYAIMARFMKHLNFTTRFYMSFADTPVDPPEAPEHYPFEGIETYVSQLDALARRIEEEELPARTHTKALESVSEAQIDLETQVGAFHAHVVEDGGAARVTELVGTLNSTLSELRILAPVMSVLDVNQKPRGALSFGSASGRRASLYQTRVNSH